MNVSILLWNVWNLPSWLTDNKSKTRAKALSPLLNSYDVVVLNEGFVNVKHLLSSTNHAYSYIPPRPCQTIFSTGLIFLSRYKIVDSDFELYRHRSGVDRFAAKGVAQVTLRIENADQFCGHLCLFGTHMQASHGSRVQLARSSQARQAARFVKQTEERLLRNEAFHGARMIFTGDLNMGPRLGAGSAYSQHYHDEDDHVARTTAYATLLALSGLRDVPDSFLIQQDKDEYHREICRVLLNSGTTDEGLELSYTLQQYTDGTDRLSDTKALCLRVQFRADVAVNQVKSVKGKARQLSCPSSSALLKQVK